jgi:hypothetical protein
VTVQQQQPAHSERLVLLLSGHLLHQPVVGEPNKHCLPLQLQQLRQLLKILLPLTFS